MANTIDHEPLLNAQQIQLQLVMNEADGIDNKALGLLATIVAVLIFIAQAGLTFSAWWHWLLLVSPFTIALGLSIAAIWPRHYVGASPDLAANPANLTLGRDDLILQLLSNTYDAVKHNNRINAARWRYCAFAFWHGYIICYTIDMKQDNKKPTASKKGQEHSRSKKRIVLPKPQMNMTIRKGL